MKICIYDVDIPCSTPFCISVAKYSGNEENIIGGDDDSVDNHPANIYIVSLTYAHTNTVLQGTIK